MASLRSSVGAISNARRVADEEVKKQKKQVEEKDAQISSLKVALELKEKRVAELEESLEEKKKQAADLEATLAEVREDAVNSKCLDQLTTRAKLLRHFLSGRLTVGAAQDELNKFLSSLGTEADLISASEVPGDDAKSTADSKEADEGARNLDGAFADAVLNFDPEVPAEVDAGVGTSGAMDVTAEDA